MKVQIYGIGGYQKPPVLLDDVEVDASQIRRSGGLGRITSTSCLRICEVLARHYGDFLGQPFGLVCDGELLSACRINSRRGIEAEFAYSDLPLEQEPFVAVVGDEGPFV
jgi:hypothetical protein